VDDCFCILDTDTKGAEFLLEKINHIHPKIKFTLETELNKKLNFLDLTIFINNNKLEFAIFRIPTQTDHAIRGDFNHHSQHKMAAFRCYVHRLLRTPLSEDYYKLELNTIKQIALNNGYDPVCIDRLIDRFRSAEIPNLSYPRVLQSPDSPVFVIPFVSASLTRSFSRRVRQNVPEARIVHKNNLSLKSFLVNSKDKLTHVPKSGIYKLKCNDCDVTYIGRTIRALQTRVGEHISRTSNSAFGGHLIETGHRFDIGTNAKILHSLSTRNFNRLNFMEDVEITKEMALNSQCVNTQVNLNRSYVPLHRRLIYFFGQIDGRCLWVVYYLRPKPISIFVGSLRPLTT